MTYESRAVASYRNLLSPLPYVCTGRSPRYFRSADGHLRAGLWLERTRLGALLTGTVIVILLSVLAANVGLIPIGQ